jgi:hypothetical protein
MLLGITPHKQLRRKLFQRKVAQSRKSYSETCLACRRDAHFAKSHENHRNYDELHFMTEESASETYERRYEVNRKRRAKKRSYFEAVWELPELQESSKKHVFYSVFRKHAMLGTR